VVCLCRPGGDGRTGDADPLLAKTSDAGPAQAHFSRADVVALAIGTTAYGVMFALHPYPIGVPVSLG